MAKRRPHRPRRRGRNYRGKIHTAQLPVTFEAGHGFVTAVIHIDDATLGLKFESPEQMLTFFTGLMEHAEIAWPDDPFIQLYMSDEGVDND